MKKLGFGLMRLPVLDKNDPASVDLETLKKMVDIFMENGFTYFDTAWMYNSFASECSAKAALVDRYPRESFTLATKLHAAFFNSFEDRDLVFNQQLEKTGAGYFDYYLLHGIEANMYPKYEQFDCFNWLLEKKEQGLVKHAGFSFHDTPEVLDEILTKYPQMEFVQLQINYLDWESEWIQSRKCYEVAVKHGKSVFVMEPAKGGTLARVPANVEKMFKDYDPNMSAASWALRFAGSLDNVKVVLSGMSTPEQVLDNISFMNDFKPLTEEEKQMCFKAAEMINAQIAVPCTGCSYCTDGCPMNIAIPKYFSLYNEDMREVEDKGWRVNFTNYDILTKTFGKASECAECGQCEDVCPQHLPIMKFMKDVSKHFDQ